MGALPNLLPPRHGERLWRASGLALLAHALLIGALALGLNWRIRSPETLVAAELWSALPQVAAPAPAAPPPRAAAPEPAPAPSPEVARVAAPPTISPTPTPARPDPQIAIEQARREEQARQQREAEAQRKREALEDERAKKRDADRKLAEQRLAEKKAAERAAEKEKADKQKADKQKADKQKAEKESADKATRLKETQKREAQAAKADEERLAKQREANLARIQGQAGAQGAPGATGTAARDAAPSSAYAGRIKARIKPNIVLPSDVLGNPTAEVEVRAAPDGTIIGRRIVKASGNPTWDDTVLRAIDRTEILPRDVDGRVPGTMILVFPRRE